MGEPETYHELGWASTFIFDLDGFIDSVCLQTMEGILQRLGVIEALKVLIGNVYRIELQISLFYYDYSDLMAFGGVKDG